MPGAASAGSSESPGFVAYERDTVDRFFADAWDERVQLMTEIASARRRIAQAKAALTAAGDSEFSCIRTVLDAQRALREEKQANARAIAALHSDAEEQAERILQEARDLACAARTAGHDNGRPFGGGTGADRNLGGRQNGLHDPSPFHEPSAAV